ncbi:hypothetical protein M413DRAFT_29552 [Hebeloma cylindrosporum]|uniref:Uncharacterized protein n=1 Tax=Hebeloma cylindrosporum TaxID=76867 RepID=A0A0C3BQM7_HEBCY|nr:hypothetical protein M413DRAFT_29552 [Hebeloma cylindrosporum h7]
MCFQARFHNRSIIVINDIPIDKGWLCAAASMHKYDPFLQTRDTTLISCHLSYKGDSRFFMVDFQGWKCHELPPSTDPAYYGERFYFVVLDELEHHSSVVIFWRWRPKKEFLEGTAIRAWDARMGDYRNLEVLREVHRGECSPNESQQFDEESGLPISPKPFPSRVWSVPTSFYPPSPPVDKQTQVPSSAGSRNTSKDPPSLLSRLSVLPIFGNQPNEPLDE